MPNYFDGLLPGLNQEASLGAEGLPEWEGDWLGVPMFFGSHDAKTNRELLLVAGFEILLDEIVELHEPEGAVNFLWVLARKL